MVVLAFDVYLLLEAELIGFAGLLLFCVLHFALDHLALVVGDALRMVRVNVAGLVQPCFALLLAGLVGVQSEVFGRHTLIQLACLVQVALCLVLPEA